MASRVKSKVFLCVVSYFSLKKNTNNEMVDENKNILNPFYSFKSRAHLFNYLKNQANQCCITVLKKITVFWCELGSCLVSYSN